MNLQELKYRLLTSNDNSERSYLMSSYGHLIPERDRLKVNNIINQSYIINKCFNDGVDIPVMDADVHSASVFCYNYVEDIMRQDSSISYGSLRCYRVWEEALVEWCKQNNRSANNIWSPLPKTLIN